VMTGMFLTQTQTTIHVIEPSLWYLLTWRLLVCWISTFRFSSAWKWLEKTVFLKPFPKLIIFRWLSSGLWHRIVWHKFTDVSEVSTASIIRMIIALMMEAENISETSVKFYQTTRRNNPDDLPREPEISQASQLISVFHTNTRRLCT
jgi:hypothetical protein